MLRVKEQTQIGAFLDWGLEKDLFVPFREQPHRMEAGKSYLVRLYLDPVTGRIAASRRLARFYDGDVNELKKNQPVKLVIWDRNSVGCRVVIDEKYLGIVYENECFQSLKPGDRLDGFVHAVRPEENRADVRLRRDGIAGVLPLKETVLEMLADSGGFLPLNSESSPAAVREYFAMSKKTFKQVIGMLYKERRIVIEENGIRMANGKTLPET